MSTRNWFGLLTAMAMSLFSTAAPGAAFVDDFSTYADGALIGQGASSPGFTGTWTGGAARGAYASIVDGKLNMVRGDYGAEMSYQHQFASNSLFSNDGDTVWTSFAFSLPELASDQHVTVSYYVDSRDTNWALGLWNGRMVVNGTYIALAAQTNYRLVSRLERVDGLETVDYWINPVSADDVPTITSLADDFVSPDATGLTYLDIHLSDYDYGPVEPMIVIDDLRIGTSFADVVPTSGNTGSVPAPGVVALLAIGLAGGHRRLSRAA